MDSDLKDIASNTFYNDHIIKSSRAWIEAGHLKSDKQYKDILPLKSKGKKRRNFNTWYRILGFAIYKRSDDEIMKPLPENQKI